VRQQFHCSKANRSIDVDMPCLNGLEFLRQIRTGQTSARRDIGFVILTSHSNTEVLSAAMALDVNGFIVKPFTSRIILDKITRISRERMTLRSKNEYASVVTDLSSLRKTRFSGISPNSRDQPLPAMGFRVKLQYRSPSYVLECAWQKI
jgi:DNA-binding NarL/FixJ family response regulator